LGTSIFDLDELLFLKPEDLASRFRLYETFRLDMENDSALAFPDCSMSSISRFQFFRLSSRAINGLG